MAAEQAQDPGTSALKALSQEEQIVLANALSRVEAALYTSAFQRLKTSLWIALGVVVVLTAGMVTTLKTAVVDAAADRLSASPVIRDEAVKSTVEYFKNQLPSETDEAIKKINTVADERLAAVAVSYRLHERVLLKQRQAAFRLDFSEREHDPHNAASPGTGGWAFRAPFDGQYFVASAVTLTRASVGAGDPSVPNAGAFLILFKNGQETSYFGHYHGGSRDGLHPAGVATVSLKAGDTLHVGVKFFDVPGDEEWGTEPNRQHNFVSVVRVGAN
jgi:hypothetical protein